MVVSSDLVFAELVGRLERLLRVAHRDLVMPLDGLIVALPDISLLAQPFRVILVS